MAEELCTGWFRIVAGSLEIEECKSAIMMEGLKKRTRKAFGIRKKEKDADSTGSLDRDGCDHQETESPQQKSNGAPNGICGEMDWERYNAPDVDEEGYSIRPEDDEEGIKGKFFSSSDSEGEDDQLKKFKIKIKPKESAEIITPSMEELKASIGNIALSPALMGLMKANMTGEEIARPRRSVITAPPVAAFENAPPRDPTPIPEDSATLFGPPLETAFEGEKMEAVIDEPGVWGAAPTESPDFPSGTPPLHPPKNVSALPPLFGPPSTFPEMSRNGGDEPSESVKPSFADLDSIFGPVKAPEPMEAVVENKWISFSDDSPERLLPLGEQAPPLPQAPPPDSPPRVPATPPQEDKSDRPRSSSPLSVHIIPPQLENNQGDQKSLGATPGSQNLPGSAASQAEPPTSSPELCSGYGPESGSSSPARPSTPVAGSEPAPPPPPPRPPSRPSAPLGKPSVGEGAPVFCPPVPSCSPPPLAPLARAESTSSISSTNSLSAANTPTVSREPSGAVSGCSRGPSPLTMGAQDTLPVAAAFTETINAYFKGADPSKCVVKITGEMVLSFPAGITRHFANNPYPAVLTFSITNYDRLEHVLPNPQLLCCDATQSSGNFWVNMASLMVHLKKVAEQKPQATYYNVDMLKYQVSSQGVQTTPLNLAVSWRCESTSTDLRIDYKYNGEVMNVPTALNNVQFLVPVDGGVTKLQAVLPPAAWNAEQQRVLWKIPDISQKSENGGVGSLLARFQLTDGPSKPAPLAVQFTSEGSTLSGCDIELAGTGYRLSLVKKRFAAGKYLAD
ncbi:SH3-containing GRB2-like protein 3-interacting protein 1 isoform X3 [Brienomyrus brachyistius]|uniref:SH3-containing GRB2-like protein 3-interacting protein 1 isoform X3 n=1 Tax=Brienomyrus brachyistius TaxID=42636 RepID=UPI0020B32BA2|nr:SH3-containing GRB2-like protein 3-interacting protein 1 isoform X3 [Brienomyrus brachyistius]